MLKIYADKSFVVPKERYVDLLFPFWGVLEEFSVGKGLNRLKKYCEIGHTLFEITENPSDSDVAVLPCDWKHYVLHNRMDLVSRLEAITKENSLQTIIINHSDRLYRIDYPNSLIFKTTNYRSLAKQNEYGYPFCFGDLLEYFNQGKLILREKSEKPVVGFCGNASNTLKDRAKAFGKKILRDSKADGFDFAKLRRKCLKTLLKNSDSIKTNFIIRDSFFGGYFKADKPNLEAIRKEYYENLIGSDYVLCVRGEGNFSNRLYEILSCGRIPIFIDTDCVLPFENKVDYFNYFPTVKYTELSTLKNRLMEFHHSLSDNEFKERQVMLRELYLEFHSPEGFYKTLHDMVVNTPFFKFL